MVPNLESLPDSQLQGNRSIYLLEHKKNIDTFKTTHIISGMNYDDLKKQYGQQYCFAPYQGDLFYGEKIRWHLKVIERHCKDCINRDVWVDIEESVNYIEMVNKDAVRTIRGLQTALACPYHEQRYAETYRAVARLFLLFGETELFEWC